MQWGEVRPGGSGCPCTHSGTHYYEDQLNGTWWCRYCGEVIEEAPPTPHWPSEIETLLRIVNSALGIPHRYLSD